MNAVDLHREARPYRELMAALIRSAIEELYAPILLAPRPDPHVRLPPEKRLVIHGAEARCARHWLLSHHAGDDCELSMEAACAMIGLRPGKVRERVEEIWARRERIRLAIIRALREMRPEAKARAQQILVQVRHIMPAYLPDRESTPTTRHMRRGMVKVRSLANIGKGSNHSGTTLYFMRGGFYRLAKRGEVKEI